MQPSDWLYSFLKQFEQYRPTAYLPTKNDVPTIGWGHTGATRMGDTCTVEQAETWLRQDVAWAAATVNNAIKVTLTQNEFDALVSLTFNIGPGDPGADPPRQGFRTSTLLQLLNAGNYAGAAAEFPKWNRQRGKVLDGLTKRRLAEQARFLTAPEPLVA